MQNHRSKEREAIIFEDGREESDGQAEKAVPDSYETKMKTMRMLDEKVGEGMDYLVELEEDYKKMQGMQFVKHIRYVMETVGNQIKQYTEAYDQIDKQIEAQPECQRPQTQLDFFQRQCVHLRRELMTNQMKCDQQKNHQAYLLRRKTEIEQQLRTQIRRQLKYVSKAKTLNEDTFKRSSSLGSGQKNRGKRRAYSLSRAATSQVDRGGQQSRNLTQVASLFSTFRVA